MALSDKNIVITPSTGQTAEPKIVFSGASSTLGPQNITLNVLPDNNGTLSFEGSAGQLFSITNDLTGTLFSVNDASGIPSFEVNASGTVTIAEFSGNVLVGTATDNGVDKLQVNGGILSTAITIGDGSAATPALDFSSDTNTGIYLAAADTLGFSTNGTPAAQFTSTGNLRLFNTAGTFYSEISNQPTVNRTVTIPDATFTIAGSNLTQTFSANQTFSGQIISTRAWNAANASGQVYLNGTTGNRIDWNINGVAAPAFTTRSAGTKLVLYPAIGAASVDYAIGIESGTQWFSVDTTASQFKWYGGTTQAAILSGAGNFTATGEVTAFSDIKLKDNIKVIVDPLTKVLNLRGVTYTRKDLEDKTKLYVGVIAQEVEAVLPEVVTTMEDGTKAVAYGNIIGLLIEAIKEQQKQINELRDKIK